MMFKKYGHRKSRLDEKINYSNWVNGIWIDNVKITDKIQCTVKIIFCQPIYTMKHYGIVKTIQLCNHREIKDNAL